MSAPKLRVASIQMDPQIEAVAANRATIEAQTRAAARDGAELVIFPECALTGYGFASRAEALRFAEPIPGPSTQALVELCRELDVHVVLGMLERAGDQLFNVAVVLGPDGVVGSYRKIHLPFLGVDRFTDPGDRPFALVDVRGVKLGLHICYDGSFPETGRVLTLLGADILVLITNWPIQSASTAEHLPACRAIENVVYVVACDRVGTERGCVFAGRSSVVDPDGVIMTQAGPTESTILHAEVDPERSRRKRLVRVPGEYELDRIGDRRPEFYQPITRQK